MENVQKMALVPHELLAALDGSREKALQRSPAMSQLLSVDAEMKKVLNDTVPLTEGERASKYAQLLRRYQTFSGQNVARTPIVERAVPDADVRKQDSSSPDPSALEREIIESVPKAMGHKAALLLKRLKNNPDVQWDEAGQLVYKGVKIKRTNVVDLVNDVLRHRKTAPTPPGWQVFAQALARDNVPYELIGNAKRRKYMFDQTRKLVSSPPPSTVKRKPKRKIVAGPSTPTTKASKTDTPIPTHWESFLRETPKSRESRPSGSERESPAWHSYSN
jgi:hypothetical protein